MSDFKYQNVSVPGVKAEDAYDELERIREERGLTPQNVVDEARPKEAILHPAFEWRDKVAAEEYRKHQARSLIRSVVVVKPEGNSHAYTNIALIPADGSPNERTYERSDYVARTADLFELATRDALSRLKASVDAVEELQRLAGEDKRTKKSREIKRARQLIGEAQGAISALQ